MIPLLSNIKEIVTIASLASAIVFGYMSHIGKQENERLENNLYSKTVQWENEKGQLVTEVTELRFTAKELRQVAAQDSSKLSEVEKQLWVANEKIRDLQIKPSEVETFSSVDLSVSNDSLVTEAVFDEDKSLIALKPIKTDHLKIDFHVVDDKVLVTHQYEANITTVVSRERDKETKKGKRRFFLARWFIPRWQYSSKNVCDDPDAKIDSAININFNKKNR